jgi:hypothetical protein
MAELERLGKAVLSEQGYKTEVQKLVEPLAKHDVALLCEVLSRAEADTTIGCDQAAATCGA